MESELLEQIILKEATYVWNIDPIDRSWFITSKNELWSEMSHRIMLKNKFPDKWKILKSRGLDDGEIEEIFTNSLIQSDYIKIGELNDYYAIVYNLDTREKNILQGFCISMLNVKKDASNSDFLIHIKSENRKIKSTVEKISKDFLFKDNEN